MRALAPPKSDPVFMHVKAGMTVIVENVINWVNAAQATHIVPRV